MTLENPTTNGGSTDYIPVTKITKSEPLTSSYVETESTNTGSVADTASGGTGLDKPGTGLIPPTAESYTQSLLGSKRPWGLDPFDRPYPTELDFSAVALGDEFDGKFNTVAEKKLEGEKKTALPNADEAPSSEKKPADDTAAKGKTDAAPTAAEVEEKVKTDQPKADPVEVLLSDPFDPKFNQVPLKNTDGVKPDVAKPRGAADTKTDGKQPGAEGETPPVKPATPSLFSRVLGGVTDTVTGAVDEVTKLPEKAAKDGTDALFSLGSALGLGADQEAARITGNAEKGKKHADSQDVQFVKQWRGLADNGPIAPPKEGDDPAKYTHTSPDKSSYTVTNGKISDFQTAPTKDNPEGVKYSDIKYDAKGQIESYANGKGQTHTRTSPTDANGFASWKSTDTKTGKPVNYGESSTWQGKPVVDAGGFHNLIKSGAFAGHMFSRHMDGSQVTTKPEYNHGKMTGLETTTTLPDNTKVSQKGHFNSANHHKLEHADTVTVKEADGPKLSQVKFDGMKFNGIEKGALVAAPTPEKSADGDSMIGMFKDILSPESLNKMKDVKELSIQRIGPNSFHVDGHMNNVFMPPPNVTVGGFGPLGRVSATPQGGFVNEFGLDMHIGKDRLDIDHVRNVHGTVSLSRQGIFGRSKGIGSKGTTTTGASWDMNSDTLVARSSGGPPTRLDARNFSKDSPTGKLLSDENAENNAKQLLQGLNKNLDGASFKQVKPGVFDVSIDLKARQIPVDAKIPNVKANIYLDDKIDFTRSAEGATFKPGEAQLGIQVGKNLEERKDIAKLSSGTNEQGEPVLKIEFHGKHNPMSIPLGKPDAKASEVKPAVKPTVKPEAVKPAAKPEVVKPEVKPEVVKPEGKTLRDLPDADLSQSYKDLKSKSYTQEGSNDPNLKKQIEALEGEKVSRLKSALGKGDEAFAKALGDIDFNDRGNANLTAVAFGNLCREGGFGGELKYNTADTGETDIRIFMKKDNNFDQVTLKSSTPSAEECKVLAAAVRKSVEQRGGNLDKPQAADSTGQTVIPPAVKVETKPELEKPDLTKPQPADKRPALKTERDATPQRVERNSTPRPTSNHHNNCNEGSHRRRLFGRRR